MKFRFLFLSILITWHIAGIQAATQTNIPNCLVGSIVDLSGQPLKGVRVKLKQTNIFYMTDSLGIFRLSNFPQTNKSKTEELAQVERQKMGFHVLTLHAHVRITVLDFSGNEIARVLDEKLDRGLYGIAPLASLRHKLKMGIYSIRLEIGPRTYFHKIPFTGKKSDKMGLRFVPLTLEQVAKLASAEVDTLLVYKAGFKPIRHEVLVQGDTLTGMVLFPDSLKPWQTNDAAYLKPIAKGVTITPLLTVGEAVPMTGDTLQAFRMGGIPDGLGLDSRDDKTARLFMNHEINSKDSMHAVVTGSARPGAYVSEFVMEKNTGKIISGDYAFQSAYALGDIAPTSGTFSRFCSGTMAGMAQGINVPIYLTGEESPDSLAFSKEGSQAIAIVNKRAFILSDFGKMTFENIVVVPTKDSNRTVAFALEDGPAHESQLYMYVGKKIRELRAPDPIYENGLGGGKLYVFTSSGKRDEGDFKSGTLQGHWVDPILDRSDTIRSLVNVSAKTLQAWSAVSANGKDSSFNFDRIEDGAYDRDSLGVFYFVTTGAPSAGRNRLGRIYKLKFDALDPINGKPPALEIISQGDSTKGFVSPDNIDIGVDRKMVICEDFNVAMPRPPAIWMLDLKTKALNKLAEIDVTAVSKESRPDAKSVWETTGIIDASSQLGAGAWLVNVQAHSVGSSEAGALQGVPKDRSLVEGGQLLLLRTEALKTK